MNTFLGGVALNQVSQRIGNEDFKPQYDTLLKQIIAGASVETFEHFGWKSIGASGSFTLTFSRFGQVFFTPMPGFAFKAPLSVSASVLWAPAGDAKAFEGWLSGAGSGLCLQLVVPTFCGVKSGPGLLAGSSENQWGLSVGATFPSGIGFSASWGNTTLIAEFDTRTGKLKRKVQPLPRLPQE